MSCDGSSVRSRCGGFALRGVLLLALGAASGCGGREAGPPLAEIGGPAPGKRVGAIRPGVTGWVRLSDLYVDDDGIAWVDADAPLYCKSDPGLAALQPAERATIGAAGGYLHVSLSLSVDEMAVARTRPREARWLPARNLGALVEAIRGGHEEMAMPAPKSSPLPAAEELDAPSS